MLAKKTGLEWHGGPQVKPTEGRVLGIGLNQGRPQLAVDPAGAVDTTDRDRLHDRSLQEGMSLDVQKVAEADNDTRPSGRIPLL
jgi:hypothetical protein